MLPTGSPNIHYEAADDHALGRIWLTWEATSGDAEVRQASQPDLGRTEVRLESLTPAAEKREGRMEVCRFPPEASPRSRQGDYPLLLQSLPLKPGDTLKVTFHVSDYRGPAPAATVDADPPLVFQVTDLPGFLASSMRPIRNRTARWKTSAENIPVLEKNNEDFACGCGLPWGSSVGLHSPLVAETPPQTVSAQRLQQQKLVQQQASDIARQLVGEVLDVQLQQFRDNNLTSHPWYGEIRSMRDHLDEMVNKQMKEVVDILEKADLNDDAQRVAAFQAARNKSREILVRIQVEQQILLRRLKIAELARQIRQLIEHQTKVHNETEALPGEPADRRQELNLAALEDQRDVTASFGQFKQSLRETSHFSGEVGREAAEAVQMVEKQQIDGLLVKAETGLHGGDFTAAAGSQAEIIAALEALLQKIRHLQKTMDANSLEQKIAEALKTAGGDPRGDREEAVGTRGRRQTGRQARRIGQEDRRAQHVGQAGGPGRAGAGQA